MALLLPGQGSQFVGMGKDLAESRPEAAEVFESANDILGVDLVRVCWEGPEEELTRTENAQPAILLHSYAAWVCLPAEIREAGLVAAGHSLGEFSAYLIAGAIGFEDALRLVRRRGELMSRAGTIRPGTMAAIIGLDAEAVAAVCQSVETGIVVPANYNAPGQIVISGDMEAVERACELASDAGARRAVPLNVSGAFHSPLMMDAREGLALALEGVRISDPVFPVVANAAAEPVTRAARARELLVEQLTSPVRWVECVEAMHGMGPSAWLEIGPGRVLRRIDRAAAVRTVGTAAEIEEALPSLKGGADA
jgi:[acyl-carrier-protein] S-malonyltransferase